MLDRLPAGLERYRYPADLPKVAAKGGPQCTGLPDLPSGDNRPFVVADTGANPWQYGNQGIVLNSDALKQWLFGTDRRTATQHRADRATRMRRTLRPTIVKFGVFGVVMALLTASCSSSSASTEPVPRPAIPRCSPTCPASRRRFGARRRHSRRHRRQRHAAAGQDGRGDVRRRPRRRAHHRHHGGGALPQPGRRPLPRTRRRARDRRESCRRAHRSHSTAPSRRWTSTSCSAGSNP